MSGQERKLAAIVFTDMVGYSTLSEMDELLALELLEEHRRALRPVFALYGGVELKTIGDAFLTEFENALLAVRAALDGQEALRNHNQTQPPEKQVHVRIGIHFAEVIHQGSDVQGDAIDVATGIEPFAAPGCICISEDVQKRVSGAVDVPVARLGRAELENVRDRIVLYEIIPPGVLANPLGERLRFLSRRRSVQAAGIAAAIVLTGVVSYAMALTAPKAGCSGAERNLAGIWDEPAKAAVERAFAGTSRPGAGRAWEVVHRELDAFASSWVAMHTEACVATEEREQPEEVLDLRVECLDGKLAELRALASLFAKADGDVVDQAAGAAYALGGVAACGDMAFLSARVKPPQTPELKRAVAEARRELAEIKALELVGKWNDGLARAEPLLARVRGLGYLPIEAEALAALGSLHSFAGHWPRARELLVEAEGVAERGRHDEVRAMAATHLAFVVGYGLNRPGEGLVWADVAGPAIERAGVQRELEGTLANAVGAIHDAQGRYALAVQDVERAWKANAKYLGDDHPYVALNLTNLAEALLADGRAREALERLEQAAAIFPRTLGEEQSGHAEVLLDLAQAHEFLGEHGRARALAEDALGRWEKQPDRPSLPIAWAQLALARIALAQGRVDAAAEYAEAARATFSGALGADDLRMADLDESLAKIRQAQGRRPEAMEAARSAIEIYERARAPDHPGLGHALSTLGEIWMGAAAPTVAKPFFQRAAALSEKALGNEHPQLAAALAGLAESELALDAPARAVEPLERALKIYEKRPASRAELARVQLDLAHALAGSRGDPARARALAAEAVEGFRAEEGHAQDAAAAQEWLASRGAP